MDTKQAGFTKRHSAKAGHDAVTHVSDFISYDGASDLGLIGAIDPVSPKLTESKQFEGKMLCALHYDGRTSGFIAIGPTIQSDQLEEYKEPLSMIARCASVTCQNFEHRSVESVIDLLQRISEAPSTSQLINLVLTDGRTLTGADRAVFRRVNLRTGALDYEGARPSAISPFSLASGEGITGIALHEGTTLRVDDVTADEWRPVFRPLWPQLPPTRAELAVPIVLPATKVVVGSSTEKIEKTFGVLNFESPMPAAFSTFHQRCIEIITQRMAYVMERFDVEHKIQAIRKVERELGTKRNWDAIVDSLLAAIQNAFGFQFVSFSQVNRDSGVVRCVRVIGLQDAEAFRRAAVHDLDSPNVQSDVIRTGRVEVPLENDPRLSRELADQFGLRNLVRVFVPMTVPGYSQAIGTISAGYEKTYRQHIYHRDVTLLKGLVAFAAQVMELSRRGMIDRVSHELNAPLSAVRNNLSRLIRRRKQLSEEQVDLALQDMETDATVLHHQVQQLEYVLSGSVVDVDSPPLRLETVLLFKDIIFKTINQLKPVVRDHGLEPNRIRYAGDDIYKVRPLFVDKSKISQVLFNLFMNAIKYVESPDTFEIAIGAEDHGDSYWITFSDWGIGVPKGLEERIFEERFRAPMAVQSNVAGSGLGLAIARQLMREHGGDLVLTKRYKPTQFSMIIPK